MAEDIKFREFQTDNLSMKGSIEVSNNQIAEMVDEIRGSLIGMLFSQGRFIGADRRNSIATKCALKQRGSIDDYCNQFHKSFNRVDISEEFRIELFLTGLREEIQPVVRKFNPKTFRLAVSLAELQERALAFASKQRQEMMLETEHSSPDDGNLTPDSSQQLNITEFKHSILSKDDTFNKLSIVGKSTDVARSNAIPCQEGLVENTPYVFDKMLKRMLIGKQLLILDELPRNDVEKEFQMFEEMSAVKSSGNHCGNYSLNANSYILLHDSSIEVGNWKISDIYDIEFTTSKVTRKELRTSDVEDSNNVIKEVSRVGITYKFPFKFGRRREDKNVHAFSWTKWRDRPLPPPEPPPPYPLQLPIDMTKPRAKNKTRNKSAPAMTMKMNISEEL